MQNRTFCQRPIPEIGDAHSRSFGGLCYGEGFHGVCREIEGILAARNNQTMSCGSHIGCKGHREFYRECDRRVRSLRTLILGEE